MLDNTKKRFILFLLHDEISFLVRNDKISAPNVIYGTKFLTQFEMQYIIGLQMFA